MGIVSLYIVLHFWLGTVGGTCSQFNALSCDECLQLGPQCAWCTLQNFTDFFPIDERCDTPEALLQKGCSGEFVEFPITNVKVLKDQGLGKSAGHTNVSYITPQKMHLQLRTGIKMGDTDLKIKETSLYPQLLLCW